MSKHRYNLSLFLFHRDLRVIDNTSLGQMLLVSRKCLLVFILTPEQTSPKKNKYYSAASIKFMLDSLSELMRDWPVSIHYGDTLKVLQDLYKKYKYNAIFSNVDYTPYAIARDNSISNFCNSVGIKHIQFEDYLLHNISSGPLTGQGTPYKKFTPYYNAVRAAKVRKIDTKRPNRDKFIHIDSSVNIFGGIVRENERNSDLINVSEAICDLSGGRIAALRLLSRVKGNIRKYQNIRDMLSQSTSRLSPYIKFGCISIREVYWKTVLSTEFIKQLHWRDFYTRIVYYFPYVLNGENRYFIQKYSNVGYTNNIARIAAWKAGKTGIPIVDAAMRQLNTTGYMHNRGRLICASFLVKILFVDWQIGEEYFAQRLTDYDPMLNNGNWQWVASTGVDSQPYFRIFNPYNQSRDHDPQCVYIKKYVPELRNISCDDIHNWNISYKAHKGTYIPPIVDIYIESEKVKNKYSIKN